MDKAGQIIEREFDLEINLKRREIASIIHERNRIKYLKETLEYTLRNQTLPEELQSNEPFALSLVHSQYGNEGREDMTVSVSNSPKLKSLDLKSTNLGLIYKVNENEYVKLKCQTCHREEFKNIQGFVNHARLAHQVEFASHLDAARKSGVPIDASEVPVDHPVRGMVVRDVMPMFTNKEDKEEMVKRINVGITEYDQELDLSDFEVSPVQIVPPIVIDWNNSDLDDDDVGDEKTDPLKTTMEEYGLVSVRNLTNQDEIELPGEAISRFHIKKKILIGNNSKYLANDTKYSYKWTVYVHEADSKDPSSISSFVRKIRFFLHPDFSPHDIIDILSPPFELTKYGWGECPVRIQIHFQDPINPPINIIHMLKLDLYNTGNYVKGMEREIEIELDRNTKFKQVNLEEEKEVRENTRMTNAVYTNKSTADVNETKVFDAKTSKWLRSTCKQFPIIVKDENAPKQRYSTAKTLAEFSSWLFGKQKAVEFHRAKIIKRYLEIHSPGINVRTKTLVLWLREEGLTPMSLSSTTKETCCIYCGKYSSTICCSPKTYDTYSSRKFVQNLLKEVKFDYLTSNQVQQDQIVLPKLKIDQLVSLKLLESLFVSVNIRSLQLNHYDSSCREATDMIALATRVFLKRLISKMIGKFRGDGSSLNSKLLVPHYLFEGVVDSEELYFLRNDFMST